MCNKKKRKWKKEHNFFIVYNFNFTIVFLKKSTMVKEKQSNKYKEIKFKVY